MSNSNQQQNKDEVVIEKETIVKEAKGEKFKKTTVRIFITTEGKTRSIVFTPAKFEKFKKEINAVKFNPNA